ncbi:hypothetical protein [Leisingera sp. S232]|uniref:hypothetical protein n=1 Tax=Leisingera sp. S232 TaxID=3415132 RepID=UPI003C7C09DD
MIRHRCLIDRISDFLAMKGFDDVTAARRHHCAKVDFLDPQRRTVMSEIIAVGLDLVKNVFQVHGADGIGRLCRTNRLMAGVPLSPDGLIPRAL